MRVIRKVEFNQFNYILLRVLINKDRMEHEDGVWYIKTGRNYNINLLKKAEIDTQVSCYSSTNLYYLNCCVIYAEAFVLLDKV